MEKVKLQAQYGLYINGQWRDASDGATYNAESPADGSHLAVCAPQQPGKPSKLGKRLLRHSVPLY